MEIDNNDTLEILPGEIRRIRQRLGLSQVEAGKCLGGGPSAFAKYESGAAKPAASLVRMLRFLELRPEELYAVTGCKKKTEQNPGTILFDFEAKDISVLKTHEFASLVEKLLNAEAWEFGLPLDGIHVSQQPNAPDGGEDARIEWRGGPKHTPFLPGRLCQFQLKTGRIYPAQAGNEVLTLEKQIKPMVRKVLEEGGSYIMLCSQPYAMEKIKECRGNILRNLRNLGLKIEEDRIQLRDSGQIANWISSHPSVAAWFLRQSQPGFADFPFMDWSHWTGRHEHNSSPWIDDPRFPGFQRILLGVAQEPKNVARVVGLPGVGKSRLVLEAFNPVRMDKYSKVKLSDLVLYTAESEDGPSDEIKKYTRKFADTGKRIVLVVDGCPEKTHAELASITGHSGSRLSLITMDSENAKESDDRILVKPADELLIERIVESVDPNISGYDRARIVRVSGGAITCAQEMARLWHKDGLVASVNDRSLIRKFVGGEETEDVYETARLISAFGTVRTKPDPYSCFNENELEQIARYGDVSVEYIRRSIKKLRRRGVVQKRGNLVKLRHEHIAVNLAEQQWEDWYEEFRNDSFPEELLRKTASRLASLNKKRIAIKVAGKICEDKKLWFPSEKWKSNSGILVSLAEIDAGRVVELIEEILNSLTRTELDNISPEQDNIVRALSIIAYLDGDEFEKAALLLFRLTLGETWSHGYAADRFKSLFPAKFSATAAGREKRLGVIDKLMEETKSIDELHVDTRLSVITDSLLEGAKTTGFSVEPGPRIHGSRPALEPWWPETRQEYLDYVRGCAEGLVDLAKRDDDIGARARTGLARNWYPYVLDGLIGEVKRWTQEVTATHPYWPEALNSLGRLLSYGSNKLSPSTKERVEAIVSKLEPKSLEDRVRFLVTEMPGEYLRRKGMDIETMDELQREELKKLAGELLDGDEDKLAKFIPDLSVGYQSRALQFGWFLAEKTEKPLHWKKLIMEEFESAPEAERSHELLVGYLAGIEDKDPKEFEKFKREAAESPVFAPVLLALTACTGISSEDVSAAIKALETNLIREPAVMNFWCRTALTRLQPSDVAPLFGFMLEKKKPGFFEVALKLMGMYMHDKEERLDELTPQLLLAAGYPSIVKDWNNESPYHYEVLMNRLISRGSEDPDARIAAILISRQLVDENLHLNGIRIISRILPVLLSNLGEIVWPLISKAVKERPDEWKLSNALTSKPPHGGEDPAILSLPENLLFGWCHANPEFAPAFVAGSVPVLKETGEAPELHPVVRRLLDEFGERGDVLDGLESNIPGSTWHGSLEDGFAPYQEPLRKIRNHKKKPVRRWAAGMLGKIENLRRREEGRRFDWL